MKNILLGTVVALFGASILQGNISHSTYGFMTVVAVVFVVAGGYSIVKGMRERRAKSS
jgi:sulfite exporter TauE/SafE